jgi:hypothetical protein
MKEPLAAWTKGSIVELSSGVRQRGGHCALHQVSNADGSLGFRTCAASPQIPGAEHGKGPGSWHRS